MEICGTCGQEICSCCGCCVNHSCEFGSCPGEGSLRLSRRDSENLVHRLTCEDQDCPQGCNKPNEALQKAMDKYAKDIEEGRLVIK